MSSEKESGTFNFIKGDYMDSNVKLLDCNETASLSKFWYKIDGKKYLVKGNHVDNTEPIMEVLSANLLDVLNYPHVEYEIGVMYWSSRYT